MITSINETLSDWIITPDNFYKENIKFHWKVILVINGFFHKNMKSKKQFHYQLFMQVPPVKGAKNSAILYCRMLETITARQNSH